MDIDQKVGQFIQLRDLKKALKTAWEDKNRKVEAAMKLIEGELSEFMRSNKVQNLASKHGTAYRSTRYSASLQDADAFMQFVIANNQFDLLDRKANANAVRDYIEATKVEPPGCKLSALEHVGVTRPGKKKSNADE